MFMSVDNKRRVGIVERLKGLTAVRKSAKMVLGLAVIGLSLAGCVTSDTALLTNTKPLLGQHFDMVVYRDFDPGKGYGSRQVSYHWEDGAYVRDSATTTHLIRFVAEPLEGNDFLVERSQVQRAGDTAKIFSYWISRKVTDGTYLIFQVDEQDLTSTERSTICSEDSPEGLCTVTDHEQLLAAARATARKPIREPTVGVIVDTGVRDVAKIQLVKDKP